MAVQSFQSQLVSCPQFLGLCRRVGLLEAELREAECQLAVQRELLSALAAQAQRPASVRALVRG